MGSIISFQDLSHFIIIIYILSKFDRYNMNAVGNKEKPKIETSTFLKTKKSFKIDTTLRLHTEINEQKILHDPRYKRINLYPNKNPLKQSNDNKPPPLSDRKSSKKYSNASEIHKSTKSKAISTVAKSKNPPTNPMNILTTEPSEKKSNRGKDQTKTVKNLFEKSQVNIKEKEIEKDKEKQPTTIYKAQKTLKGIDKYTFQQVVGSGTFGVVYKGRNKLTLETIAIKKVLQDPKYKNREHEILKQLNNINVLKIKDSFFTSEKNQQYLNVIMDYYPDTAHSTIKKYNKKNPMPPSLLKLYAYQMFRGLLYLNKISICHRDIKPHNILIDPKSNQLVICDFGSAKRLVPGESNIAYICSRCYRAPELIFGATQYNTKIDMWSVGCVLIQMLLFQPIFLAESSIDQLVEIIKILGTPSEAQVLSMNPKYNLKQFSFPKIIGREWKKILKEKADPLLLSLISSIMKYNPNIRVSPFEALSHPYFDELRDQRLYKNLKKSHTIPQLFNFNLQQCTPHQLQTLTPTWYFSQKITSNKLQE